MKRFVDKVAIVTGAASGVGRATALRLAEEGAKLALYDINGEGLAEVKKECEALGADTLMYTVDISNEEQVNAAARDITEKFGRVDLLVNNAAIFKCWSPFIETPHADWQRFFDVNVMGTVFVTRSVLGGMIERGYGRIVNVSSVAGVYGNANMAHYSASKGAVNAFSQALAKEVIKNGVIVNSVCPGTVSPGDNHDIDFHHPSELCHAGRTGTDRENANFICFLLSDEATYIAGQNLQIDGGRRMI